MHRLRIIHLSDLHFGVHHRFAAASTIDGERVTQERNFSLHNSLSRDWAGLESVYVPGRPQLVALTGDLTCGAGDVEFDDAGDFVTELTRLPVLGKPCSSDQVFVVPGNHDVLWEGKSASHRIQKYLSWYNSRKFVEPTLPQDYRKLTRIRQFKEGQVQAIVVELNSCLYIEKNRADANRGRVDDNEVHELDKALKQLPIELLNESFRILILHHHPVLLPQFAEAGRGYDAVENVGPLLAVLHRHRFHLVLHGHKHLPGFTEYQAGPGFAPIPWKTLIAGGGSAGANTNQLPTFLSGATNTYSILELSTESPTAECSVTVELRGLQLYENHEVRVPESMLWETIRRDQFRIGSTAEARLVQPAKASKFTGIEAGGTPKLHVAGISDSVETASIIRSLSASLAAVAEHANRNDYFATALQDTLGGWRARANELAKGELQLYDSITTNNVVREMYERARTSVFSTCAQKYLDQWPTRHGQSLLAAHKAGSAKVTRVFLFKSWHEVTHEAVSIMAQQVGQDIATYAFIDDETPFDWPQELTKDFTVIDDGAAIGITTAFLHDLSGEPQTQATWYFENRERMSLFRVLMKNLIRESLDYNAFKAHLGKSIDEPR